ncbi:hypothetical protein PV08_05111 [Exophiala spinifera]|uniref:Uncharacterized protein n=1 Tax=Exophiala spinifera TaxID=91928 RepID=A0A0D1YRP8_9EURO|nr:uncharacterized protein PV08_05111 [Exophiala spinifera]KIW17916.1 hypothetical protein PV08_05111 [Exophiala spinifera]
MTIGSIRSPNSKHNENVALESTFGEITATNTFRELDMDFTMVYNFCDDTSRTGLEAKHLAQKQDAILRGHEPRHLLFHSHLVKREYLQSRKIEAERLEST